VLPKAGAKKSKAALDMDGVHKETGGEAEPKGLSTKEGSAEKLS